MNRKHLCALYSSCILSLLNFGMILYNTWASAPTIRALNAYHLMLTDVATLKSDVGKLKTSVQLLEKIKQGKSTGYVSGNLDQ